MNDKLNQFVADVHAGKYNANSTPDVVEVSDPTNYAQCMDLAYAWCDYIQIPRITIQRFYAYQIWTQPNDQTIKYFEMIPNTPMGLPQCGDIVVFSNKVGTAGHVSIATGTGDTNSFQSFDQNWGSPKTCRYVSHDYTAVLGWLRVRQNQSFTITDQTVIPQIIDENGNQMEVQAIRSKINDQAAKITSLNNEVDALNAHIQDLP